MRFCIHSPYPYWHRSGGYRAMYALAVELQKRGHRVGVQKTETVPTSEVPPGDVENAARWSDPEFYNAVHIYPESTVGNPAQADRVVRWVLTWPGVFYPPMQEGPDDLIVAFHDRYWPGAPRLNVEVIEPEFFYPKTKPGKGRVYWFGKGRLRDPPPIDPKGLRPITHMWPETRKALGDLLRSVDVLISFDENSAMNQEAIMCGTPVLLGPGTPATDGGYGIAASEEGLVKARADIPKAWELNKKRRASNAHDVDKFVKLCRAKWGETPHELFDF
jgi:hypothetical protein